MRRAITEAQHPVEKFKKKKGTNSAKQHMPLSFPTVETRDIFGIG